MVEPLPGDTGHTCLAAPISRMAPARDQRKVGYPTVGGVKLDEGWIVRSFVIRHGRPTATVNIQSGHPFNANDLFDDFAGFGYSGPGGTAYPCQEANWSIAGNPKDS